MVQAFPIETVLAFATGYTPTIELEKEKRELIEFITGISGPSESMRTLYPEARKALIRQHPWVASHRVVEDLKKKIQIGWMPDYFQDWAAGIGAYYGQFIRVQSLPQLHRAHVLRDCVPASVRRPETARMN